MSGVANFLLLMNGELPLLCEFVVAHRVTPCKVSLSITFAQEVLLGSTALALVTGILFDGVCN